MKKYKLLKAVPFCAEGVIFTQVFGGGDWYSSAKNWVNIHQNVIDNNPEWFELIEEKEFTESQVREAMKRLISKYETRLTAEGVVIMQQWIITELRNQIRKEA